RPGAALAAGTETRGRLVPQRRHRDPGEAFEHECDLVIAATGYCHRRQDFLAPLEPFLARDDRQRPRLDLDHAIATTGPLTGKIFVVHADTHSHGVAAPDLGICAVRNATILNAVAGRELYRLPRHTAYTRFEAPRATRGAL